MFRKNVGIALFSNSGLVFWGRRIGSDGPEIVEAGKDWQMPQGGIEDDESPLAAAQRELWEETGVARTEYIAETGWLTYRFPPYTGLSAHRLAPYEGQTQKWFALRCLDNDSAISLEHYVHPEFSTWRWERLDVMPNLVVSYKRDVYIKVREAFYQYARV